MKYFRCRNNGKRKMLECERDLIKENRYDKKDSKRLKRIAYKLGFCEEKKEIYKEKADKQTVIVDQSQKTTNNTLQFNKSKTTKTDINVQDVKVLSDNQKTSANTSKQPSEKKPTNTKKPQTKKKPTKPKK